jgi:hypothetical protein
VLPLAAPALLHIIRFEVGETAAAFDVSLQLR